MVLRGDLPEPVAVQAEEAKQLVCGDKRGFANQALGNIADDTAPIGRSNRRNARNSFAKSQARSEISGVEPAHAMPNEVDFAFGEGRFELTSQFLGSPFDRMPGSELRDEEGVARVLENFRKAVEIVERPVGASSSQAMDEDDGVFELKPVRHLSNDNA